MNPEYILPNFVEFWIYLQYFFFKYSDNPDIKDSNELTLIFISSLLQSSELEMLKFDIRATLLFKFETAAGIARGINKTFGGEMATEWSTWKSVKWF